MTFKKPQITTGTEGWEGRGFKIQILKCGFSLQENFSDNSVFWHQISLKRKVDRYLILLSSKTIALTSNKMYFIWEFAGSGYQVPLKEIDLRRGFIVNGLNLNAHLLCSSSFQIELRLQNRETGDDDVSFIGQPRILRRSNADTLDYLGG